MDIIWNTVVVLKVMMEWTFPRELSFTQTYLWRKKRKIFSPQGGSKIYIKQGILNKKWFQPDL
jgi:hypothetical protein